MHRHNYATCEDEHSYSILYLFGHVFDSRKCNSPCALPNRTFSRLRRPFLVSPRSWRAEVSFLVNGRQVDLAGLPRSFPPQTQLSEKAANQEEVNGEETRGPCTFFRLGWGHPWALLTISVFDSGSDSGVIQVKPESGNSVSRCPRCLQVTRTSLAVALPVPCGACRAHRPADARQGTSKGLASYLQVDRKPFL